MQIFHNSRDLEYRRPFGAVRTGESVRLALCVKADKAPLSVMLRTWFDNSEALYPMKPAQDAGGALIYSAEIAMPDTAGLMWYYFIVDTDGGRLWYGNNEQCLGGIGQTSELEAKNSFQITVYKEDYDTPQWFRGRIMYQIFPDRFYGEHPNGEIHKKRDEYIIHHDRYEGISFNPHPYENGPACNDFYGGNLKGITAKLPYIKSLGVGVIYLNPIFDAYSNHKYDTANYKEIDSMFGTEEDFAKLCSEAEALDIKIILDGVFSHTGADSIYFNKYKSYGEGGAYNDFSSPYRGWYHFGDNNEYESWWGCSNLPNVDELNPSYLDYILRDDDSVIKKWLRLGASGWRLDVADELPDEFIKILRREVKKVKPDAVIIGEVWEDASNKVAYSKQREYLLGDELDSVMNYPFKDNVTAYIMGYKSAEAMNDALMSIMENYPAAVYYSLMNLLGTHDTIRIKSLFGGLNPDCGTTKLTSGMETLAAHRLECASFMQMTFPGVPSVYYGDEAGMQGGRDPYNRGTFPWRSIDVEMLEHYRTLGHLRNTLDVLKNGYYKTLYANDGVIAYARFFKDNKDVFGNRGTGDFAVCAVNRSFESFRLRLDLSEFDFDYLSGGIDGSGRIAANGSVVEITIPPVGYVFIRGK